MKSLKKLSIKKFENNHASLYGTGIVLFYLAFEFMSGSLRYTTGLLSLLLILFPIVIVALSAENKKALRSSYYIAYGLGIFSFILYALKSDMLLGRADFSASKEIKIALDIIKILSALSLLSSIIYLIFVELSYRSMHLVADKNKKRISYSRNSAFLVILMIPTLIALNYLVSKKNYNFDFSKNRIYSLQEASVKLIKSIHNTVDVYAFFPVGGITVSDGRQTNIINTNALSKEVEIMLEQIRSTNPSKINLQMLDARPDAELAQSLGVTDNKVVVFKSKNYTDTGSIQFLTQKVRLTKTSDLKNMEEKFLKALLKVNSPRRIIYFCTQHGEVDFSATDTPLYSSMGSSDFDTLRTNLRNANYTLKKWDIENGYPSSVPKDAAILAFIAPQAEITKETAKTVKQYLQKGGNLFLALSAATDIKFKELLEPMQIEFENKALHYDYPPDKNYSTSIASSKFDNRHPIVESLQNHGIKKVYFYNAGYFKNNPKLKKKYKSLDYSKIVKTEFNTYIDENNNKKKDKEEIKRNKAIVMAIQNKAFNYNKKNSKKKKLKTNKKFKIVLSASYPRFSKGVLNYIQGIFYTSLFTWLTEDRGSLGITAKMGTLTPVSLTTKKKNIMYYAGLIIIPGLILAFGIFFVPYSRKKIQKK